MDDNVLKMPAISECQVSGGFDEIKGKSYITLTYQGIAITEYYEDSVQVFPANTSPQVQQQVTMTHVARRARHRLGIALAAKAKREKNSKFNRKISALQ